MDIPPVDLQHTGMSDGDGKCLPAEITTLHERVKAGDAKALEALAVVLAIVATVSVSFASAAVLCPTIANWGKAPETSVREARKFSNSLLHASQPLEGASLIGSRTASVGIIQYSDYECSFCATFARDTWLALKQRYVDPGKVLVAFRHLPLSGHPYASTAAAGAYCAGQQHKFWEMHDLLFAFRGRLKDANGRQLASRLGMDLKQFDHCVKETAPSRIQSDVSSASLLGINAIPTFLIGRLKPDGTVNVAITLVGAPPLSRLQDVLDDLLQPRAATQTR